jgi:hypothetical protein
MDEFVPYYPAFLSLRHRLVVIIGGGAVAERRVRGMVKYQADILVVSPEITPRLEELEEECAITVEHRGYVPPYSIVVPGTRAKAFPAGTFQLGCALIVGRRSERTDLKTSLNDVLREYQIGA